MELKLDKTTKILLGAIALGLFLNASDVIITKALAELSKSDLSYCLDKSKIRGQVDSSGNLNATFHTYC